MKIDNLEHLFRLYRTRASSRYGLNDVNQLQHALLSVWLASERGASPALAIACLFHDVGHMLGRLDDAPAARGLDDRHEVAGARALERLFGMAVAGPVRLHVAAKRYLCAVDSTYHGRLSSDSVRSLVLQGGPMTPEECDVFERETYCDDAQFLRRCDEDAKDPAARVPDLDRYVVMARGLLQPKRAAD